MLAATVTYLLMKWIGIGVIVVAMLIGLAIWLLDADELM